MQALKKIFVSLIVFVAAMWAFAPKEQLYYKVEHRLKERYDIVLDEKTLSSEIFGLRLENVALLAKGVNLMRIDVLRFRSFLVYTDATLSGIKPQGIVYDQFPVRIDRLRLRHHVLKPLSVHIEAQGDFGKAIGSIDLRGKRLVLRIVEPKKIEALRRWLQKDEEGWFYVYAF